VLLADSCETVQLVVHGDAVDLAFGRVLAG
jgi:hypothetical protein